MKVGIIGFGGMASYHFEMMTDFSKSGFDYTLDVVGVYDISEKANENAKKRGLKVYSTAEELLSDPEIETVLIATPNDFHCKYAIQAAKAKKNIICEKPIALNEEEIIKMFDEAEKNGVLYEVHQNRRWDEDFLTVKKLFDDKSMGDVYFVESNIMGSHGIPGGWRKIKSQGGGMMLDWGVHLIDRLLFMIDSKVKYITCDYSYIYGHEVEDGFRLLMTFENGIKCSVIVDTNTFRNLPLWQVYGEDGTATIEDYKYNGGVTVVKDRLDPKLTAMKKGNGLTKTMADRSVDSVVELPIEKVCAPKFEFYRNFCAAAHGKEKKHIKNEEVLRVFKVMKYAEESALTHKTLEINV